MILKLRLKGGAGSGHRGHAGRQGKRGGSVPGVGGGKRELFVAYIKSGGKDEFGDPIPSPDVMIKATTVLDGIMDDDRLRNLAVALSADGDVASTENFDVLSGVDLVGAMYSVDPEMRGIYSNTSVGKHMHAHFTKLYGEYNVAISAPGHWQKTAEITPARRVWEKKYYGREVGGHVAGQKYAANELNKYIASVKQ